MAATTSTFRFTNYDGDTITFPHHTHTVEDTIDERNDIYFKLDSDNLIEEIVFIEDNTNQIINGTITEEQIGNVTGSRFTMTLNGSNNINGSIRVKLKTNSNDTQIILTYIDTGITDYNIHKIYHTGGIFDESLGLKINSFIPFKFNSDYNNIENICVTEIVTSKYTTTYVYIPIQLQSVSEYTILTSIHNIIINDADTSKLFFLTPYEKDLLNQAWSIMQETEYNMKYVVYSNADSSKVSLINGSTFNKAIRNVAPSVITCTFTNSAIPIDKLDDATLISYESTNNTKAFMYTEDDTVYISPDKNGATIMAAADSSKMFKGCNNLKTINFNNFNTENIKNSIDIFKDCNSLENINGIDINEFNNEE